MTKIFVQNVGSYVCSNVAKALAKKPEVDEEEEEGEGTPGVEVIGTLKPGDLKPRWVSRVIDSTPQAMRAAFIECEMTVIDCFGDMEAAETMLAEVTQAGELEDEKVLIGLSSVVTWTRTSPDADEPEKPLTEEEYKRRRPHANFKDLLALEKLVTKAKRPGLRTHVVAAGLTYGNGEDVLHPLFKKAWSNQPLPIQTLTDGTNLIPTIHVTDLASVVDALLTNDGCPPYIVAVDAGQQQETKQSLNALTAAISAQLGIGSVEEMPKEDVLMVKDYEFFQTGVLLEPASINDLGFEWHCQSGLLANLSTAISEFRSERGLKPLCVLVHGNDEIAISEMASSLAKEYKLPHVKVSEAVKAARAREDALASALSAHEPDAVPTNLLVQVLTQALTTAECRNQGYMLEGFPTNCEEAALLFPAKPAAEGEGEEEEEEAAADEEEGEEGEAPKAPVAAAPEFVLVVEAEAEAIKAKMLKMPELNVSEEALLAKLSVYETHNAEDSPTSILAAPSMAASEALSLKLKDDDIGPLMSRSRILLGAPRNYGPTEEEIAAAKAIADAEEAKAKAEAKALALKQEAEEKEERERREALESRRLAELQQQEKELLEVRSVPLRAYLMQHVIPTLTEGLIEVCKLKPEDPIDHLAEWLFKNNPVDDDHFE